MTQNLDKSVISWLLEGDPAIRWQVMRDLLDQPRRAWEAERQRVATTGWGAEFLKLQDKEGTWSHTLYGNPKWTCTTYTLLLLRDMGLPQDCPRAVQGTRVLLDRGLRFAESVRGKTKFPECLRRIDTCVAGMWFSLGLYFDCENPRLAEIAEYLLDEQMPDGGWNCRRVRAGATHSSFHTTLNVLDGIRIAISCRIGPVAKLKAAEARAIEFMLMHHMYISDRTGKIIKDAFTQFSFPPRWHYDVLRGLDYLRSACINGDKRLREAYALLNSHRLSDGRWPLQNRHPGKVFFNMESVGQPSRWNTLRALRVLRDRQI